MSKKEEKNRCSLFKKNNSIFFVRDIIVQGNKKENDAADR
jgi:hypothetical protein